MERLICCFGYVDRVASEVIAIVENRPLDIFQGATDSALDKGAHLTALIPTDSASRRLSSRTSSALSRTTLS